MMHEPSPDVVLARMTSRNVTEWIAYFRLMSGQYKPPDSSDTIQTRLNAALGK